MRIYVVKPGDTIDRISEETGTPVQRIAEDNQLIYPYELAVGQALFIADGTPENARYEDADSAKKLIVSNGYAYPFISRWVLEQTLPYLTELSVFSYGFTEEGELVYPLLDDGWLVETAGKFRTRAVLTLTPLGADGMFDNRLISAIVRNEDSRAELIKNLLEVMALKGYLGLDIDFEYILPEDRDAFSEFVRVCADSMHRAGYTLSVALAPKTSADQPGLLYESKDYHAIGEAADSVLLMTYEWGYTLPHTGCRWINKFSRIPMNGGFSGKRLR